MTTGPRTYGGRSGEERLAERRARLVAATVELLGTRGESATTMTAICRTAGLTERYFYESFRHRDEALAAALDAVSAELAARVLDVMAERAAQGRPVSDAVEAGLEAVADLVMADPAKGRVLVVESGANEALRARRRVHLGEFARLVGGQAASLYGDRAWPPERARLHGIVFVAGLAELVASWLLGEVEMDRDELVHTGSLLFEALVRRPDVS